MVVRRRGESVRRVAPVLLTLPGTSDLGDVGRIVAREADITDSSGGPDSIVIDAGRVRGELVVDAVGPGDRMRPLGMEGTRKLSDLFVDAKIPRRERLATPVVRDGESVVWLAGVRMSEDYKVVDGTAYAMRLTWERGTKAAE
jgi:tRNA(Ile)-lysidine synthase